MYDRNVQVAREAVRSAGRLGREQVFFVPPLDCRSCGIGC